MKDRIITIRESNIDYSVSKNRISIYTKTWPDDYKDGCGIQYILQKNEIIKIKKWRNIWIRSSNKIERANDFLVNFINHDVHKEIKEQIARLLNAEIDDKNAVKIIKEIINKIELTITVGHRTAGYKKLLKPLVQYKQEKETRKKVTHSDIRQLHILFERFKPKAKDQLSQYMLEIEQYPKLTKEEEFELAKKIREQRDENSLEKLIGANLKFVVSIAKKYQGDRLPLLDLINAGNEGLIHAAQRFDEHRGIRFHQYAYWCIRQAIYNALSTSRSIVPRSNKAKRIQYQITKFVLEKGRQPTDQELAEKLNMKIQEIAAARLEFLPTYSLDEIYKQMDSDLLADDENTNVFLTHYDYEHDEHLVEPGVETVHIRQERKAILKKALQILNVRQRQVIEMCFGMGNYEIHSLEDIARLLHISRERVRQIRNTALDRLRRAFIRISKKV